MEMKKQILICFLWDVLFWVYIYGVAKISLMLKYYSGRTMNTYPTLWAHIFLLLLCGGLILLLVYVSNKYQGTVKSAALEFLIIGIPAFYMATAFLFPTLLFIVGFENLRYPVLRWMIQATVMDISSILFGYELDRKSVV